MKPQPERRAVRLAAPTHLIAVLLAAFALLSGRAAETGRAGGKLDRFCAPGANASATNGPGGTSNFLESPWRPPAERQALNLNYRFTASDGRQVRLADLNDSPLIVSFFYTRCRTANKCSAVAQSAARDLQRRLTEQGLVDKARIALITYDPAFDTPARLNEYARTNDIRLNERNLFLQPAVDDLTALLADLGTPAAYYGTQVSMHRIRMLVIDKSGRLARSFDTLLWDNDDVIADIRQLLAETGNPAAAGTPGDAKPRPAPDEP